MSDVATSPVGAPATPDIGRAGDDGRLDLVATGPRFLRWFVIVVVTFVVAEVAARAATNQTTPEIRWYDAAAQQRIEMLEGRGGPVDVVFAGTSAAWQAFVPAEFTDETDQQSFNVGLAGAVPTVMGPWLVDQVAPRVSPDVVVWGLTPLDFAPAYGDLQDDAYNTAVETAGGWLADLDRSASSVSTLIASRRLLRSPSDLLGSGETQRIRDLADAATVTGPDGERIDFESDVSPQGAAIQRSRLGGFDIDHSDVDAIVDAIIELQVDGITVVLVEVPVPDRFTDQLPQPERDLAAVRSTITEIGESTNSDVILMGDVFGDTNFVDDIHVDAAAAAQATRWLGEILVGEDAMASSGRISGCAVVEVEDGSGFVIPIDVCRNAGPS